MKESRNTIYFEIVRETSKYNKYIKWFYRTYREDGTLVSSGGYKTQKEAQATHDRAVRIGQEGFPIGNMVSYATYLPKEATCVK
jgi:hypothetical protein